MRRVKKRKKRILRPKKFLTALLSFGLLILGVYSLFQFITKPSSDLIVLNFDLIPITSSHKGVILRHELVNNTLNSGVFQANVEQAERVKNTQLVGNISVMNSDADAYGNFGGGNFLLDEMNLSDETQGVYQLLLNSVKQRNYVSASFLKEELESKLLRLKKLSEENSQNAFELKQNQNKNVGDLSAKEGENINLYSNESGIVSFLIDSLENDVNYNNRYRIDYEKLWNSDVHLVDSRGQKVTVGQPIFKIIKPSVWYIACEVAREDLSLYEEKRKVLLDAGDKKVEATIYEIFDAHNYAVLLLKINNQLPMLFDSRIVDVTLIRNEVRGLVIPKTAVLKKGNELGVYALDSDNRLKYLEIGVIVDDGERYIVQEGNIRKKNANDEIEIIRTVKNGDVIIDKASEHGEGELIKDAGK